MPTRYEVLNPDAGAGGFGRVQRALDRDLERQVAIKILDPIFKLVPSAADKERFRREARTLATLSHPNIPSIYDVEFDEEAGDFRIIFQWIEGMTLAQHLRDRGILTLEQARRWFANVSSALDHAHSRGVIHRDIKPSNIIIASDADACILVDFGISLSSSELTSLTGSPGIGTPGYMSPEQEKGADLTPASDVYALGILLYECLAGTRPALGGYRPLSTVNDSIPPTIDNLIQQCLREEPTARVQSAAEFQNRLQKALEPHTTFSATLTSGSLYEIQVALGAMSAPSFAVLPIGQRLAIRARLNDLVRVDEDRLANAVAALLTELVRVSHSSRREDFGFYVEQSLIYAYERRYGEQWAGNNGLREALSQVALEASGDAHIVLCAATLAHLDTQQLDSKGRWYLHELRVLLQNLLANPVCAGGDAEKLATLLDTVNQLSHKTSA